MRISASLFCIAASLAAAPAFAQVKTSPASSQPAARTGQTAQDQAASQFSFGLGINRGETERTLMPIGPVAKDQLELKWKPAGNWDVTLDLTSRSPNDLFPREEVTAGVGYQVTPRFRLGGGVTVKGDSLAASLSNPAQNFGREGNTEASVRIESAFSF